MSMNNTDVPLGGAVHHLAAVREGHRAGRGRDDDVVPEITLGPCGFIPAMKLTPLNTLVRAAVAHDVLSSHVTHGRSGQHRGRSPNS